MRARNAVCGPSRTSDTAPGAAGTAKSSSGPPASKPSARARPADAGRHCGSIRKPAFRSAESLWSELNAAAPGTLMEATVALVESLHAECHLWRPDAAGARGAGRDAIEGVRHAFTRHVLQTVDGGFKQCVSARRGSNERDSSSGPSPSLGVAGTLSTKECSCVSHNEPVPAATDAAPRSCVGTKNPIN